DSAPPPTGRRQRRARSRSIRIARVSHREARFALENAEALEREIERPHTRSECAEGPRPCPHVSCRHHLYLDVNPHTGTIKLNFPDLEVWELAFSCALDVADLGGTAIDRVGELMNVTRERVRQIETQALSRLAVVADTHALRDFRSE
ncbi:MAG TPA: sigma factor-like helix-turn-helix DNA-binding protein, partial [Polyangiaceae bacterium]